jgi:chlorite dismutase
MLERTPRSLDHFVLYRFREAYFNLKSQTRLELNKSLIDNLSHIAEKLQVYQVFPAQAGADILVWSVLEAEDPAAPATFLEGFACAANSFSKFLEPTQILWGFTRPSQYTKTRSNQEIDPFSGQRKRYLVMYPFVKTTEWYLMSREARQGMMNEHIRIGKQYPEIRQLLLYSFGLQDQEFIVVYEMDDLVQFSDLVYELRDSEARRFTLRDTPLITALFHPPEETLALWEVD